MKRLLLFIPVLLLMQCSSEPAQRPNDPTSALLDLPAVPAALQGDVRKLGGAKATEQELIDKALAAMAVGEDLALGCWVAMFGENKINITITERSATHARGFTVCAGNFRAIVGTVRALDANRIQFSMDEPGDNKYDGHFEFEINIEGQNLRGSWKPFKAGVVPPREFALQKTAFRYQPELGDYPQASQRLLVPEDVDNLLADELKLMRNEIYARHGYSFKEKAMRRHFDAQAWYVPMGVDVRQQLTDVEAANITLIYRYEKYAAENYSDYGR